MARRGSESQAFSAHAKPFGLSTSPRVITTPTNRLKRENAADLPVVTLKRGRFIRRDTRFITSAASQPSSAGAPCPVAVKGRTMASSSLRSWARERLGSLFARMTLSSIWPSLCGSSCPWHDSQPVMPIACRRLDGAGRRGGLSAKIGGRRMRFIGVQKREPTQRSGTRKAAARGHSTAAAIALLVSIESSVLRRLDMAERQSAMVTVFFPAAVF